MPSANGMLSELPTAGREMTPVFPKVSVIIVNWNGKGDTLDCLQSLADVDYPDYEVIVVDNGSTDGSTEAIRNNFPDVTLLETGRNLGFAGGNNVGIRRALESGARYLFLLNNDTIVDPHILTRLAEAAEQKDGKGIFSAKIYTWSEPAMIWYAGAEWVEEIFGFMHVGQGKPDSPEYGAFKETDYACGCALFVSADVLRKVGLLEEDFFLTFEEADLCYRAKKMGFRSYYVPGAIVRHKVSTAFGGENSPLFCYFLTRNRLLWAERHLPFARRLALYRQTAALALRCLLPAHLRQMQKGERFFGYGKAFSAKRKDPFRRAHLFAIRDYLLRRFGDCSASVRAACARKAPK